MSAKKPIITNAAYYEARGQARTSLVLSVSHKEKLDAVASQNKAAVGDVVEAMLDLMPDFEDALVELLRTKKEEKAKTDGRSKKAPKREILKSLAGLNPEQLAAVEAQIQLLKGQQS